MKNRSKVIITVVAVVVVAVVAIFVVRALTTRHDGVSYITRPAGYADIASSVHETGTVNPVNQVAVGSEVSGTVRTLHADFNDRVKTGQVLATLDPTTFQAAVDSSKANLALTQASLNSAQVNVGKMKALLDLANLTLQRDEPLLKQGLINQNQVDTDRTGTETARQDYLASQAAVRVGEAQVSVARGQLEQAQYNLSKTIITSPFDGIVMARNVSIGQTVAASLQTPTLFTLATNLTDMQVDTSVDEADVGSVKKGAKAQITVTAFPNVVFDGTVQQVRINPTVVQNVVTYDAVVQVHDTSGRLFPGMTAQVTIETGKRAHVLSVPIAAILYRPLAAPTGGAAGGLGGGGGFGAGVVQSSGGAGGAAVAGAPGSTVTVWVLRDARPTPTRVVIGLSDSANMEITSGNLAAGDPLVIAQRRGGASRPAAGGAGGGQGGGAGGNRAGNQGGGGGGNGAARVGSNE
jgi:HlyD family secretion protein